MCLSCSLAREKQLLYLKTKETYTIAPGALYCAYMGIRLGGLFILLFVLHAGIYYPDLVYGAAIFLSSFMWFWVATMNCGIIQCICRTPHIQPDANGIYTVRFLLQCTMYL